MTKSQCIIKNFSLVFVLIGLGIFTVGGCNGSGRDGDANVKVTNITFTDVTFEAGVLYKHDTNSVELTQPEVISGGVAAGDYDSDGWVDLYVVSGAGGTNLLFRNLGNGSFEELGADAGVDVAGSNGSGPHFVDYDGDGHLDIFIGGVAPTKPSLYRNTGEGIFEDVTESSGITMDAVNTFSAAFGDYDMDGDLDLFATHWFSGETLPGMSSEHLWNNNGDGTFTDVSIESGITSTYINVIDYTFTPNFADINNDGYQDLLIAGDFLTSQIFINQQDGTFLNTTDADVITDENGMGAAVGDYDNDGDLDWFVSSIFDPNGIAEANWGISGNRLYRNNGDGTFQDVTIEAGVEHGFWGWGSCMSDFDNDGNLDIAHVNGFEFPILGMILSEYVLDPTRLFMSNGDGTFTEKALDLGLDDTGQGRGIVCFDYDRDGDIDIFIANNDQNAKLFRNDGDNENNYLGVKLEGLSPNSEAIGARITINIDGKKQMRELRSGSNFVSQNPVEAHFGVGNTDIINEIQVTWPDGLTTTIVNIDANQILTIQHPSLI